MSKLTGSITISNPSDGLVSIELRDETSGVRFMRIRVKHADLMQGLMGLAERPMTFEPHKIDAIGKRKLVHDCIAAMPKGYEYKDRDKIATEQAKGQAYLKSKEDSVEWTAELYFGSRDTFFTRGGTEYVNVRLVRYE